ncbi:hypothetical protein XH99_02810 [Bradyrhizobium nanningense]|uniref:Uncharacterized protein n=1 Tax=Bradyrhizobium nanningense TaxID=1325118 RepID=A0A4Q0SDI8_9BRAD|nr:hypothetical protein XH84_30955 [Bradyrhizobium nanningense]RXH37106.1 hypothetical protein XH99_02810 [Bradyrhizobium nanningense]
MMRAAQWYRNFVTCLTAESSRLHEFKMVGSQGVCSQTTQGASRGSDLHPTRPEKQRIGWKCWQMSSRRIL